MCEREKNSKLVLSICRNIILTYLTIFEQLFYCNGINVILNEMQRLLRFREKIALTEGLACVRQ